MARWQRIITAASGITLAISTFVASGHSPFYTNEGLHVSTDYDSSTRILNIRREGSNLNCWIRLRTAVPAVRTVAHLSNGQPLDVRFGKSDSCLLFISQTLKKDESWPKQFTWTSGVVIRVEQMPALKEWDVYPDVGTPDSSVDARRRTGLVGISIIGLFAAVAAAIIGAFPENKPSSSSSLSARTIIDTLMSEVAGSDEAETAIMHRYIRTAVVIGAHQAQARMKWGKEKRLALDADLIFRKRFVELLESLNKTGEIFLK